MEASDCDDCPESMEEIVPSVPVPKLDAFFNFELVVFQVNNTLFRVLKFGLDVPGTIFEAMFTLPCAEDANMTEGTIENPIILSGIDEHHFRSFLNVLYPLNSFTEMAGYEDWIGVLHLATMWNFTKVRAQAITVLSRFLASTLIKSSKKILLGREYGVWDWVRTGLIEICRNNAITLGDLLCPPSNLDWETIGRVFCVRDKAYTETDGEHYCSCDGESDYYGVNQTYRICHCRCSRMIEEMFSAEVTAIQSISEDKSVDLPKPSSGTAKKRSKRK